MSQIERNPHHRNIAYFINQYPNVTHSFIRRVKLALVL